MLDSAFDPRGLIFRGNVGWSELWLEDDHSFSPVCYLKVAFKVEYKDAQGDGDDEDLVAEE